MKKKLLVLILALAIYLIPTYSASAEGVLVKCKDSTAFQERVANYPNNYYFEEPDRAYGLKLRTFKRVQFQHSVFQSLYVNTTSQSKMIHFMLQRQTL